MQNLSIVSYAHVIVLVPLTTVPVSGNHLGAIEWGHIANAVKRHPYLEDLADFKWSPSVLAPSSSDIILADENLGEIGAVVLGPLLERRFSTLTLLQLRYSISGLTGVQISPSNTRHTHTLWHVHKQAHMQPSACT